MQVQYIRQVGCSSMPNGHVNGPGISAAQQFWPWESCHSVNMRMWASSLPTRATSFSWIIQDPGKESNVRMHWCMTLFHFISRSEAEIPSNDIVIWFVHAFPCANHYHTELKNLSNPLSTPQLPYKIPFRPSTSEDWRSPHVGAGAMALAPRSVSPAEPELLGATAVPRRGELGPWNMVKHPTKLNWLAM